MTVIALGSAQASTCLSSVQLKDGHWKLSFLDQCNQPTPQELFTLSISTRTVTEPAATRLLRDFPADQFFQHCIISPNIEIFNSSRLSRPSNGNRASSRYRPEASRRTTSNVDRRSPSDWRREELLALLPGQRIRPHTLPHPPTPGSPPIWPRLSLETTTGPVAIDPAKSALVVVDLQNYFLSALLGRPSDSVGMKVVDELLGHAIPACRKAGIPIMWLGLGLTEDDIEEMPPTIIKGFAADTNFRGHKKLGPLGSEIGPLELDHGKVVEGGRVMMRGQWNMALYPCLAETAEEQDIWVYQNRLSGFWGGTGVERALRVRGIRTLIFAGANTDQCVDGRLQDAFTKGWDCLMLSDGCATSSPEFCKQCIEFNCEAGRGFVLSCKQLADGVRKM